MESAPKMPLDVELNLDPADFMVGVSGKNLGGIDQQGNLHSFHCPTPPVPGDLVNDRAPLYLLFSGFVFLTRYSFFFIVVV